MSWISAVLALVKAIPWFQEKFDELMMAYVEWKVAAHEKRFVDSLAALIGVRDQTKLEEAIGSDNAGKPAIRRDGVQERPRNENPGNTTIP